jgi:hypothetical protein
MNSNPAGSEVPSLISPMAPPNPQIAVKNQRSIFCTKKILLSYQVFSSARTIEPVVIFTKNKIRIILLSIGLLSAANMCNRIF